MEHGGTGRNDARKVTVETKSNCSTERGASRTQLEERLRAALFERDQAERRLTKVLSEAVDLQAAKQVLFEKLEENRQTAENFRLASERLQKVLSSVPVACIGICTEGNVYEWNAAAERDFGYTLMDMFEQPLAMYLLEEADRDNWQEALSTSIANDQEVTVELPTVSRDGGRAMHEFRLTPVRGASGAISSVILSCVNVTERILEQQRLAELAFKDALTGLLNRRAFMERYHDAYASTDEGHPMSVILLDVDKFKVFNDTHGHPAGDALLRRVGEILPDVCGELAIPARYGGEEFIVMAVGLQIDEAIALAERIRLAIQSQTTDVHGGATASLGVACTDDPYAISAQDLIQSADTSLYAAKHSGRNRVVYGQDAQAA